MCCLSLTPQEAVSETRILVQLIYLTMKGTLAEEGAGKRGTCLGRLL